ncbi:MAG: choice-of-anchor D domain-containing protein [Acidobacteriaceae bacterium]
MRFSSDSGSDVYGGRLRDRRFRTGRSLLRSRRGRSRRFLLYFGLAVGFCVLLAFVGCGSTASIGELTPTESTFSFGAVSVGQTSSSTVSFLNTGGVAVQITQVNITGQPFKLANPASLPITVAAGSTYNLQVQFKPSSAGTATGQLTLTSNVNAGGLPTATLSGLGVQTVSPPAASVLSGVSCNNSAMIGAGTDSCFVALNGPAGGGGLTVSLSSTNPAVTVPATVTVPANTTGVGFAAKVAAVSSPQGDVLTATEGGVSEAFALQLDAAQRILSASAIDVSFGYVAMNSPAIQSVILTSSGTEPVTITSTSLTGSGFSIAGLVVPVTLNPEQVIVLNIEFDPASAGSTTGKLTLTTNDTSGGAIVINLSGDGAAGGSGGGSGGSGSGGSGGGSGSTPVLNALSCSSASMTGAGVDNCTVTLTTAAPAAGVVVTLASSNPAVAVPASVTIPGGAVSAGFAASASAVTSAQTASLIATYSGATQSFALQLNAAGAFLSVNATSVAFGSVSLNTQSTQMLTLTSTGTEAVTVSGATLSGLGFTLSGVTFPVTLNPGQSVSLGLVFVPTAVGIVSGQLTLSSNATTGGSVTVALSGTGATAYSVDLTWDGPSTSADPVEGYNVYRSPSGASAYSLLNTGVTLTTAFTDNTAQSGNAYDYVVTSVDSSGVESAPSNTFAVTIP